MSPRHAGRDAGGEGEGEEKPICSYISSFRFQIQDYAHSVERRVFTYLELFFFSIFVHSNLESMRCSLIRSNHSYQVVFKYLLKVLFFLGYNSAESISLVRRLVRSSVLLVIFAAILKFQN